MLALDDSELALLREMFLQLIWCYHLCTSFSFVRAFNRLEFTHLDVFLCRSQSRMDIMFLNAYLKVLVQFTDEVTTILLVAANNY